MEWLAPRIYVEKLPENLRPVPPWSGWRRLIPGLDMFL
jgi:hypothetical protein